MYWKIIPLESQMLRLCCNLVIDKSNSNDLKSLA